MLWAFSYRPVKPIVKLSTPSAERLASKWQETCASFVMVASAGEPARSAGAS